MSDEMERLREQRAAYARRWKEAAQTFRQRAIGADADVAKFTHYLAASRDQTAAVERERDEAHVLLGKSQLRAEAAERERDEAKNNAAILEDCRLSEVRRATRFRDELQAAEREVTKLREAVEVAKADFARVRDIAHDARDWGLRTLAENAGDRLRTALSSPSSAPVECEQCTKLRESLLEVKTALRGYDFKGALRARGIIAAALSSPTTPAGEVVCAEHRPFPRLKRECEVCRASPTEAPGKGCGKCGSKSVYRPGRIDPVRELVRCDEQECPLRDYGAVNHED